MSLMDLVYVPNPLLRKVCEPVRAVTPDVVALLDGMVEVMRAASGIGLAAVQVGILKRVVVMEIAPDGEKFGTPEFLINPTLTFYSEEKNRHEEGCLSIPGLYGEVERPARVRVAFLDREGREREEDFEGLRATCIQHEIDHLNGVLFVDHLPRLIRERSLKKYLKQVRLKEREETS